MESINSIFSFRALIVLLLIVDSTLSAETTASHGQACNEKRKSTNPAKKATAKTCEPLGVLLCWKKIYTNGIGSATKADNGRARLESRDTGEGTCLCKTGPGGSGNAWNGKTCGPPSSPNTKDHGTACYATDDCKEPFKCGVPGTAVAGKADDFGDDWTAGKNDACMDPFKCGVPGTAEAGKGDNFGVEWTSAAGKKGKCACKDKKAKKGDKCELPGTGTGDKATSQSARIIYQSISLQLAIGCFLYCCSS